MSADGPQEPTGPPTECSICDRTLGLQPSTSIEGAMVLVCPAHGVMWQPEAIERTPQPPGEQTIPDGVPANLADFGPYTQLIDLEPGDTPLFGIAIMGVLHADGSCSDQLAITGTVTSRDVVGSIEMVKLRLALTAYGLFGED